MSIAPKTLRPRGVDLDPAGAIPAAQAITWAELSILEAKEMSAEALRIVAKSKDVCRRSNDGTP